jgi:hypothetical protein
VALSYELGLAEPVEPARALDALRQLPGAQSRHDEDLYVALDDALFARVRRVEDPTVRDEFHYQFGFDLGLSVGFSMGHKTDPDARAASERRLAIAAIRLPIEFGSDAGLMFQSGAQFMLRRAGQFTLYGDWRPWRDPGILATIEGPYTKEPIPVVK